VAFVDEKRAVAGGGANSFAHLDLSDGKEIKALGGHKGAGQCCGRGWQGRVVSAGLDHTIKVWDADGTELFTLQGHTEAINALVLLDGGKRILSASADKTCGSGMR